MSKIRECIICSKQYEYCPNCKKYNTNEQWRMLYCSENCMAIDKVRDNYRAGKYDARQAKIKLSQLNVPQIDGIQEWARGTIAEILGANSVIEEVSSASEEVVTVIEEAPIIEDTQISSEDIESTEEVIPNELASEEEIIDAEPKKSKRSKK